MQLSGYHRFWGCSITIVHRVKDFLYSGFMYVKRSGIMGMNFVLLHYFQSLLNFLCDWTSAYPGMFGGALSI